MPSVTCSLGFPAGRPARGGVCPAASPLGPPRPCSMLRSLRVNPPSRHLTRERAPLKDKSVVRDAGVVGRTRRSTQAAADRASLVTNGIPRVRAELAARIGELRVERDWNWSELAGAADVSAVQIEGIEAGRRDPSFSTLIKIAVALELCSLDELLGPMPFAAAVT